MEYTFSDELYSDLHKDAFGFRPYNANWIYLTDDEKQADWDYMCNRVELNEKERAESEAEGVKVFEKQVAKLVKTGLNIVDARRWLVMADFPNQKEIEIDYDYFCYNHGMPYGYFKGKV